MPLAAVQLQQDAESESRLHPVLSEALSSTFSASTDLGQVVLP